MNSLKFRTLLLAIVGSTLFFAAPDVSAQPEEAPTQEGQETSGESEETAPAESAEEAAEAEEAAPAADEVQPEEEASAAPVYSLEDLLNLASKNAAVIEEHRAKIERAEWQEYRAHRAWTPKIEATTLLAPVPADADPSRFDNNLDEILNFNIGPFIRQSVRVVMPVYTFGRIATAKELAALGLDVAKVQAEQARQDHFFQLKQAYYGYQLSQAFAEMLKEGDKLVKENLERMEDEFDFGEATFDTADLRRLQIFNAELDGRILDNARLGDLTEAAIQYLAGVKGDLRVPEIEEDAELPGLATLERYWELAMEHRPEIVQLNRAVKARELAVKLEKRNYLPNIFLAADFGVGWSTEDVAMQRVCRMIGDTCVNDETLFTRPYSNPFHSLTFGVALGASWQLDIFGTYGKVQETHAQYDETLAQRERALGALRLEITKKHREAMDNLRKIEIQSRALSAARSWRNQFGARLHVGRGTNMKDAIDPLRAYYEARVSYLEARHNYLVSRAALARAIGLHSIDELELSGGENTSARAE